MILPFNNLLRKKFYEQLELIFNSNVWTDGDKTKEFEEKFSNYVNVPAKTISSGGAGLLAILDYIDIKNKEVIVPTNTFWASTRAIQLAGGIPVFADISKKDLCITLEEIQRHVSTKTKAIMLVHIGGHIAFDTLKIADFCKDKNLYLVEDCAHAHGATWNGSHAGSFGFAGSYSFYATKTMPTGDGGIVVSKNKDFLKWLEKYKNYGKEITNNVVSYPIKNGFNYRLSEFTAALGIVQLENLQEILNWKRQLARKYDEIFNEHERIIFPDKMISGYYKYIVFKSDLKQKTGQVFGPLDQNHIIAESTGNYPNSDWISQNHQCAPIWYGWKYAEENINTLKKILYGNKSYK